MAEPFGVVRGTLELVALRTVDAAGPMHGFEILDWVREATGDELILEDGALYPALRRMEIRGWLSSDWGVSEKGRRARYYRLTSSGREALAEQDARWEAYVEALSKLRPGAVGS